MDFTPNTRTVADGIEQPSGELISDSVSPAVSGAGGLNYPVVAPPISGDPQDDDAAYLDEMLDETPGVDIRSMPTLTTDPDDSVALELSPLPPITSMQTRRWSITNALALPVQLFPADPFRTELFIKIEGAAGDALVIAGSKVDAQKQGGNAALWNSVDVFYSVTHTGEVWIWAPTAAGTINVSAWAITCTPASDKPRHPHDEKD